MSRTTGNAKDNFMMTNQQQRERLALAMGSEWVEILDNGNFVSKKRPYNGTPWNPETDANDDYAVLEWMRSGNDFNAFSDALDVKWPKNKPAWAYQIGDYVRAALKVLDEAGVAALMEGN